MGERDAILVVDDDAEFRELISLLATELGFSCLQASSWGDGVAVAAREHAHLRAVLLDYYMPGGEPAECAAEILASVGSEVPVVLVSAALDIAERAAEVKLDRYIAKPFELDRLQQLLAP